MAIPIPSGLPLNLNLDQRHNELITPPSAPTVVENIKAIDPRVALNMPMPVSDSKAGAVLNDATQALKSQDQMALIGEPVAGQAVLLELTDTVLTPDSVSKQTQNLISASLAKMDALGGAALGQLLSEILQLNFSELGAQSSSMESLKMGDHRQLLQSVLNSDQIGMNSTPAQSAVAVWPGDNKKGVTDLIDPRVAMTVLYKNLQNSGIFAAEQLRKLLFSSGEASDLQTSSNADLQTQASHLLSQLEINAPTVPDSVKLLLRGDLLWQGQLMPNIRGRIFREDAWQADPKDHAQIVKGSKITMEVTLPNLGPFKVVGTQFGESVHVAIQTSSDSQAVLSNAFSQLLEQMRTQVDPDAKVSMKGESDNT